MSKCSRYIPGALVRCDGCGHVSEDRPERIEFCVSCGSADADITKYLPEAPLTPGTLIGGRRVLAVVEGIVADDQFPVGKNDALVVTEGIAKGFCDVLPVTVIVVERGEG